MNPEFLKQALAKVGDPNTLINLVSRRVRQLTSRGGETSRSLLVGAENLGAADIALREIIEDKMGWELPEIVAAIRPLAKKVRRTQTPLAILKQADNWSAPPRK
ncbi:MAG: DNA-directed RNA polymerase subunit omega [Limisphaerales bacterium]